MRYTVRLFGEVQGRYNTWQVAMNHTRDLIEALEEMGYATEGAVTVNGKAVCN